MASPQIQNTASTGEEMHALVRKLYPICRSITGEGVRETLRILEQYAPIQVYEVPSGTAVFDWTVPKEWNIKEAYIKDPSGRTVVDFRQHNLHILQYSVPVRARMPLSELREHLFTLPEQPDRIPYRTSYYREAWGFAMTHRQLSELPEGEYEVVIDSKLEPGHLTYGECRLPGRRAEEILISTHVCHPSLANDNLSGIAVAAFLAGILQGREREYSYRLVFVPGLIGPVTWLAQNEAATPGIRHGLVLTCLGDPGGFTYKKSRRGDADIDRAMAHVLAHDGTPYRIIDFSPVGYDERQYCSPGFNLPLGCLMRTPHGEFPEYHTSADNPDFVTAASLGGALGLCLRVLDVLEKNRKCINLYPRCEPQLGKRGLYRTVGGTSAAYAELARLWVLNLSDGDHTLLDIAVRSGIPFEAVAEAAGELERHGLLEALQVHDHSTKS
ncbi:MAG TPA: DUF4910 domain-containing protein [Bryobacteraceae bacterium]|nr:DUF4910 domain-containing protein [Bryobacteraceae bacterium]